MNNRKPGNVRVKTACIRARKIDNRLNYTTHTIVRISNKGYEFGSLDVNERDVRVYFGKAV